MYKKYMGRTYGYHKDHSKHRSRHDPLTRGINTPLFSYSNTGASGLNTQNSDVARDGGNYNPSNYANSLDDDDATSSSVSEVPIVRNGLAIVCYWLLFSLVLRYLSLVLVVGFYLRLCLSSINSIILLMFGFTNSGYFLWQALLLSAV